MKRPINLAVLLFCGFELLAQPPGNAQTPAGARPGATLSGIVTDSAGGKPLAGVSVFLNNTSRGTITKPDGSFQLNIPRGTYQVVFSDIGYATAIVGVNGSRLPASLRIKLQQQATELTAITVEPYIKNGWRKYGKFFWNNFIGMGENASSCSILNKEVLRFHFFKRGNRLSVTATEPLQIENNALGYVLEYKLEEFVADYNTNIITFFGYPFFREMTPKKESRRETWVRNRRSTYLGSMLHFMRSLYAGHSIGESFLVQRDVTIPNAERRRVRNIYRPDFQKPGLFPMDTLYYFWDVLRQPDPIQRRIAVSPDTLVTTNSDQVKKLYFDGLLTVTYGVNNRTDSFRQSGIRLMSTQPVTVEENGNYYPSKEILTTGFWGQSEKISNLLPLDYAFSSYIQGQNPPFGFP